MNNKLLIIILLIIVIFASGCTQKTSQPGSSDSSQPSLQPLSQPSSTSGLSTLPAWVSGQIAQLQLTIPNGNPPYQCSLKPGSSLPEGFTLSNDCKLAGAPILAAGSTRSITPVFSVIITDSSNPPGSSNPPRTEELPLTVTIVQSAPRLIPVAGGICTVNKKCEVVVAQADGGTSPYHFQSDTFVNGAPPMGMVVNLDGILTGTPSKAGTYTFGVCVVDSVGASQCDQTAVTVEELQEFNPLEPNPSEQRSVEKIPETWDGKLTGTKSATSHCVEGEFSYSIDAEFTFPSSLSAAISNHEDYDLQISEEDTSGKVSSTSTVTKQMQTSKQFYPDCKLVGASVSDEPIVISVGYNSYLEKSEIRLNSPGYNDLIVDYLKFDNSGQNNPPGYGGLVLAANDMNPGTISGTWFTTQFGEGGPHGTFTITKK